MVTTRSVKVPGRGTEHGEGSTDLRLSKKNLRPTQQRYGFEGASLGPLPSTSPPRRWGKQRKKERGRGNPVQGPISNGRSVACHSEHGHAPSASQEDDAIARVIWGRVTPLPPASPAQSCRACLTHQLLIKPIGSQQPHKLPVEGLWVAESPCPLG
jgi:hypothetical protein